MLNTSYGEPFTYILVDDFLVTKHLKNSAKTISKSANIKGFRKGKVPYNVIESQYGKDYILENSLDAIIQEVAQENGAKTAS